MSDTHFEKNTCEICGAAGRALYRDLPDVTYHCGYAGSLSVCCDKNCGAVWANPFPKLSIIPSFYDGYYTQSSAVPDNPEEQGTGNIDVVAETPGKAKQVLRGLAAAVFGPPVRFSPDLRYLATTPPGKLLDIGCGNGAFLSEAKQRGWSVFGQEFDGPAAEKARQASGAEVRVGSLQDVAYDAESFDAVSMGNVLEHLPNPRETLDEIYRLLKSSGVMVSVSPNPKAFLHGKYGEHWRGLEVPRHLFLLPPASTRTLCERAGFTDIQVFSTPGEFSFMEAASAGIRAENSPKDPALPTTSKLRLMAVYAATLCGWNIGEWTVAVARKP